MRVQEVVVNASTHIAVAEARARDAEMVTRATELEANGKLANMQRVMQDGLLKAQAEAQETERQKQNVELQLQQMREEAARRDLQMQQLQADTEHKLRELSSENQRLQAEAAQGRLLPIVFKDTNVGNAGQVPSQYADSTVPSTPTQRPKQYFFENAFGTSNRPIITYSPTILAPPEVVATESDKNFGFGHTQPQQMNKCHLCSLESQAVPLRAHLPSY